MFRILTLIVILLFSVPGAARAQSQADEPRLQQLQTAPARQMDSQDGQPTLTRRALDLLTEDEDEQAAPPRGREPAGSYGLTCANIHRVLVQEFVIRLSCYDRDRFGNFEYALQVGSFDGTDPGEAVQRWYASEFLQAVYYTMDHPGAALSLRVYERAAYEAYIRTFTIVFEE
jgi:hypothetical protein